MVKNDDTSRNRKAKQHVGTVYAGLSLVLISLVSAACGGPAIGLSYGYGWFIGELNDHQAVSHGGGIDGFVTEIRRYIEERVTIILLSNRDTTNIPQIADQIAAVLFEK